MWNSKHYKLGFDMWGLTLLLMIMLPNFLWFALPAPNDILRRESVTPLLDTIAQAFQIIIATSLCGMVNITRDTPIKRKYQVSVAACIMLYFSGWTAYYAGIANTAVIFDLCLAPCAAFLFFALARKNAPALISAAAFTACHLIFATVNFVL